MKKDIKEAEKAYDKLAEFYHKKRLKGKTFNQLIERPASFALLGNVKRKKVLDAGCGSGIYSNLLAKKGAKVSGLELSKEMLDIAKDYCKYYKIDFKQGSIDNIPYKNNSFDIILSSLVIHYLKNPEKAFKEFNRVLKKNGTLVFSTHHPVFAAMHDLKKVRGKNIMSIEDYFKEKKYFWKLHGNKTKIPSYTFNLKRLVDIVNQNGFIIERIEEPFISKKVKGLPKHLKKWVGVPTFIVVRCRKVK